MLFNSIEFLIFFFIFTSLYFIIPKRYQKHFLLGSSVLFYSYFIPWHILILVSVILLNFYFCKIIEKTNSRKRKLFLISTILINVLFLFIFKYFNFINSNLSALASAFGWNYSISSLELILPLGLSFYTFKCICYDLEVYRKNILAEKNLEIFALYIAIYPELLAGPIDRPKNLLIQLRQTYGFDYTRITNGLKLMAWGFFQKWVIADRLAMLVNAVYDNFHKFNGLSYVMATFFFAIQIYCDFSAYSDIAIGTGEVLGFTFMKNFNRPYFAKSISEFWRRWHISLSTWLRDYIYLPIAYSMVRKLGDKKYLGVNSQSWSYITATLVTMFIAGLWHGAKWTYISWGTLIGIFLVMSFLTRKVRKKLVRLTGLKKMKRLHKIISIFFAFSMICISWIFFRSNTLGNAVYIVSHIYTGFGSYIKILLSSILHFSFRHELIEPFTFGFNDMELYLAILFIGILFLVHIIQTKVQIREYVSQRPLVLRWAIYLILIFIILIYGKFENRQFIYMQF